LLAKEFELCVFQVYEKQHVPGKHPTILQEILTVGLSVLKQQFVSPGNTNFLFCVNYFLLKCTRCCGTEGRTNSNCPPCMSMFRDTVIVLFISISLEFRTQIVDALLLHCSFRMQTVLNLACAAASVVEFLTIPQCLRVLQLRCPTVACTRVRRCWHWPSKAESWIRGLARIFQLMTFAPFICSDNYKTNSNYVIDYFKCPFNWRLNQIVIMTNDGSIEFDVCHSLQKLRLRVDSFKNPCRSSHR
jgi:hypothetical protein